jgi:hypothetical protein
MGDLVELIDQLRLLPVDGSFVTYALAVVSDLVLLEIVDQESDGDDARDHDGEREADDQRSGEERPLGNEVLGELFQSEVVSQCCAPASPAFKRK